MAVPLSFLFQADPNFVAILTMGLLFLEFLFLVRLWGKKVYQEANIWQKYGLFFNSKGYILLVKGLAIGLGFTWGLFTVESFLGWVSFQSTKVNLLRIITEGFISALGVGFAEELFFRGWLLDELQRDYTRKIAVWANALIFATLHFLKPLGEILRTLPQFPGLIILGLTLVWAKESARWRLSIAIGLHAGLVWGYYILNVGEIVTYTNRVSPWVTGVDGNPVAGLMGLFFLGILGFWFRRKLA
ncbi:MAG: CPBP family intramembrane glutamic endopeptidase [Oscillatoria sp. PMC 1068.18]|nr:CPBP family intramembrane glutamic endopeptidase [Oscillatoria sp. PMC 1076.18]MEC4991124.1 CPBP family intramembrane glutamic endopeptidase [Oscillatoria sp. PMC 1068.18]